MSIGMATLIPNFLGSSIFFSVTEISSLIGVVNKLHDETITTLMTVSESKRDFEPQIHAHLNGLAIAASYCAFMTFV